MKELEKVLEEIRNEIIHNTEIGKEQSDGMVKAMNIIRKHMNDGWISIDERLPEDESDCEVALSNGEREIAWYNRINGIWYSSNYYIRDVIAWKEPSIPYQFKKVKDEEYCEKAKEFPIKKIDILKDEIINYSADELAKLINSYGKCLKCANFFKMSEKDNAPHCYAAIRNSNCIKGITEYLQSDESFEAHFDGIYWKRSNPKE